MKLDISGISQKRVASEMGIQYAVLNEIINCKRAVSSKYALLFEAALGIPLHILTGLQSDYDMQIAKQNRLFIKKLNNIHRIAATL